jgi:small subunit ribosomal protein S8
MTDPISDMLTRIRNAGTARHTKTSCPSSNQKLAIARILKEAGFVGDVKVEARGGHPTLVIGIRYDAEGRALIDGIRRVSTPGRRVYVGKAEIPSVRRGLGVAVLSTPKGMLSDKRAREEGVGGEVVCEVW